MPCKMLGKMLEQLENVDIEEINAVEELDKVDEYNVCSTPTLIFLDDSGKEVARTLGMTTLSNIKAILKK